MMHPEKYQTKLTPRQVEALLESARKRRELAATFGPKRAEKLILEAEEQERMAREGTYTAKTTKGWEET